MEGVIVHYKCTTCLRWNSQEGLDRRFGKCFCGATRRQDGTWVGGNTKINYALREWSALSNAMRAIVRSRSLFHDHQDTFLYEFIDGELAFWLRKEPMKSVMGKPKELQPFARFGHGKAVHRILTAHGVLRSACGVGRNGRPIHANGPVTCKKCSKSLSQL